MAKPLCLKPLKPEPFPLDTVDNHVSDSIEAERLCELVNEHIEGLEMVRCVRDEGHEGPHECGSVSWWMDEELPNGREDHQRRLR